MRLELKINERAPHLHDCQHVSDDVCMTRKLGYLLQQKLPTLDVADNFHAKTTFVPIVVKSVVVGPHHVMEMGGFFGW